MTLYLSVIFVAVLGLIGFDSFFATKFFGVDAWTFVLAILISLMLAIIINIFFAVFVTILPKKWFGVSNKLFAVSKKERKFYENIKIRKWKDKVWELGGLGGFSKSSIKDPHSPEYVERFIIESKKGMLDHISRIFFGFLIILIYPEYVWVVGFPIAIVNLFLNLLSTMVLRYNLPKLEIMHARLIKYSKTFENQDEDQVGTEVQG